MLEFAVTVILTVGSALLFGYWFRYTCLLILSAKTARDYACDVATANQLSFLQVQTQLRQGAVELDALRTALAHDYDVVTYLLKNAAHSSNEESSLEARMLEMNYRLMSTWYQVSRRFSVTAARKALEEMSLVVGHFANVMGERAACGAAA
ncbi:MAG TPA: hypothetical protein VGN17_25530 [Bryobacteraceae bacterium]|jgi:hypothetical protein